MSMYRNFSMKFVKFLVNFRQNFSSKKNLPPKFFFSTVVASSLGTYSVDVEFEITINDVPYLPSRGLSLTNRYKSRRKKLVILSL